MFRVGDLTVFGCEDGFVRSVTDDGRIRWQHDLGRAPSAQELLASPAGVFVLDEDGALLRLDPADASVQGQIAIDGQLRSLRLTKDRLLVTTRLPREGKRQARDRLAAWQLSDMTLSWEYEDEATFTGAPSVGGRFIAISGADGDVVLIR